MAPKRKRRASPSSGGLAAGEYLKRNKLAGSGFSPWGWVGTEVTDPALITMDHRLLTCGFSRRSRNPFCTNKYASMKRSSPMSGVEGKPLCGELENEVIVVADDVPSPCSKKVCKNNPNCLNHLGQEKWEDDESAWASYINASDLGPNPILHSRDPNCPVGLKNLGATCYANAFLQVWFRDLAFRNGVYQCQSSQDGDNQFKDSPIFQLQVTFAALQESTQNVFNPFKLVESLKLSTSEQQDSQEFSKLFMSHLDAEFKKQSTPSLRSLVSTQFQGQQVYGTICGNCHSRSERESDFLELEISFENNSRLEDCISTLLLPEKLSGDNRYFCATCNTLQDATRYTELRQLPPVLHFSLLRFVYDVASMERKKSKHGLSFPTSLNMDHFLGSTASRKAAVGNRNASQNIYDLRGVLLHKGPSAYHGHYESQVFDTTSSSWFQFDDETVTKIESLGDRRSSGKEIVDVVNGNPAKEATLKPRTQRSHTKKRRINDSDDELRLSSMRDDIDGANQDSNIDTFSSKDAYMLIYVRREEQREIIISESNHPDSNRFLSRQSMKPPPRALEVVNGLNAAHDEACELFAAREKELRKQFEEVREKMRGLYCSWNVQSADEEAAIVSQHSLSRFLTRCFDKATQDRSAKETSNNDRGGSEDVSIFDGIECSHGALDPQKSHLMKRISTAACHKIESEHNFQLKPVRRPESICKLCVERMFTEKLYQLEHPKLVAKFDSVCDDNSSGPGYWISKQWLRDWRLAKPKMHNRSQGDLPPNATEFESHVTCEHGRLSVNATARRCISAEACCVLRDLFPSWKPFSIEEQPCPICENLIYSLKEDKREIRKQAEDEKTQLRHMHDNALTGNTFLLEDAPCAILPAQFVQSWRQWLNRPTDAIRPHSIDNSQFICRHTKLVFDPNCASDLDSSVAIAQRKDWDILKDLYPCGPLISIEKRAVADIDGNLEMKFVHEIPVCAECRLERKLDYETTEITIRILKPEGPKQIFKEGLSSSDFVEDSLQKTPLINVSRRAGATRRSRRIRQVKDHKEKRKIMISKLMNVKDIKVLLQEDLQIPTIYQRIFHRGQELEDNSATVESLGILVNDVLDLIEEDEDNDHLSSDSKIPLKTARAEERGFDGTLLVEPSFSDSSGERGTIEEEQTLVSDGKPCPICTYCNSWDALVCEMCEIHLN